MDGRVSFIEVVAAAGTAKVDAHGKVSKPALRV